MGISSHARKLRRTMMEKSAEVMAIAAFSIINGGLDTSLTNGTIPVSFRAIRVNHSSKKPELYRDGTSIEISSRDADGGKTIYLTLKEEEILQKLIKEKLEALCSRGIIMKGY